MWSYGPSGRLDADRVGSASSQSHWSMKGLHDQVVIDGHHFVGEVRVTVASHRGGEGRLAAATVSDERDGPSVDGDRTAVEHGVPCGNCNARGMDVDGDQRVVQREVDLRAAVSSVVVP